MLTARWSSGTCLPAGRARKVRDDKMYVTYVLKSLKNNQLYIGFTNDIDRRLAEHNAGNNKSTKGFRPYKLIFSKIIRSREEARNLEKKLKSGYMRERFRKM